MLLKSRRGCFCTIVLFVVNLSRIQYFFGHDVFLYIIVNDLFQNLGKKQSAPSTEPESAELWKPSAVNAIITSHLRRKMSKRQDYIFSRHRNELEAILTGLSDDFVTALTHTRISD